MNEKCFFFDECHSSTTTFCNLCDEWFCDDCRMRYKDRMIEMVKKRIPNWFSRDEVNDMKEKGTWKG